MYVVMEILGYAIVYLQSVMDVFQSVMYVRSDNRRLLITCDYSLSICMNVCTVCTMYDYAFPLPGSEYVRPNLVSMCVCFR